MFISRLKPDTCTDMIDKHINEKCKLVLTSERLITKYNTYASFVIRCPFVDIPHLLQPEMWPEGAILKKYYE